ncbi:hypothetical protein Pden_3063 [Paracoccus denitrificans PD1222]|uniref:Uncharacterized protein n=1 Tax=Paracoccus denitrificans (strain Pd 1222) TaxID=318586 RepID=A1B6K0_PARDP|nr:hypothetical protein Pden_3063 [Paracoccus denitrificans PD1222]
MATAYTQVSSIAERRVAAIRMPRTIRTERPVIGIIGIVHQKADTMTAGISIRPGIVAGRQRANCKQQNKKPVAHNIIVSCYYY